MLNTKSDEKSTSTNKNVPSPAQKEGSDVVISVCSAVDNSMPQSGCETLAYLKKLGVSQPGPKTSAFDPGYDPLTLVGHLRQSAHLISCLKISMACWQVADERSTRRKISAAQHLGIPVCTGGGPFEVAAYYNMLPDYLDLCAHLGVSRIEAGEGFTDLLLSPSEVVNMANDRGLSVQFEVGKKHEGAFTQEVVDSLVRQGERWLVAGAVQIIVEARESAEDIGIFGAEGELDTHAVDRFINAFGVDRTVFEAPDKASQFALINYLGSEVHLMNVRLEEILRVEIYRRGLHSDAFSKAHLRPKGPCTARGTDNVEKLHH